MVTASAFSRKLFWGLTALLGLTLLPGWGSAAQASGWVDAPLALAVDAGGNVYVTGTSEGAGSLADYATVKYSPTGVELWVKRYNGPGKGYDNAVGLALNGQGHLYVTGTSYGGPDTGDDYATLKYRVSDGKQLWVQRFHGD